MAPISKSCRTTDGRSGGKILRGRRTAAAKTPYDRPILANGPLQNPNWLTGLVFPTSRMIATGATKLLSSIFGPDTSSSSSSSDSDSSSEDGIDDEKDDDHIPFDGVDGLSKNGTPSEMIECYRKEPQLTVGKSETKCVIEKLLMQETFSREECDRLIRIISLRVIDGSTIEEGQDGRLDITDLCSKAVMEAKQWLEEKKVASSSKSDLDRGTCTLRSVVLSQVTKSQLGSPMDMAKLYMRARPPWASPPINYVESTNPSPMGRELLKEETPDSVAGNSSFSSKQKKYSLASGSGIIQEELRRVRSKASEDMLKTLPSTKIDLLSFALEPKSIQNSFLTDKTELGGGDKLHALNFLPATKSIDASMELVAEVRTCHGFPASVLKVTQDGSCNEDLTSKAVIFSSTQHQYLAAIQTVEGEEHAISKSRHPTIPDLALEHDSRLSDRTCSTAKEVTELRPEPNANGLFCSGSSLSAGDIEQNRRSSDDKNANPVSSSYDNLVYSAPVEETCELLSEASVEVPIVNETDSIASDSHNSSSMKLTKLDPKHGFTGKTNNRVEKRRGRKPSGYNRKGWGRVR